MFKKVILKENELREKIREIYTYTYKEVNDSIKCKLLRDKQGIAYFAIQGAEIFGFHEQTDILVYQETNEIRRLLRKAKGKEILITPSMMQEFGIVDTMLQPAVEDIFQAQINTSFLNSSYITNRIFDAMLIDNIQNNNSIMRSDIKLLSNDLFHNVPLISDVAIKDIVQLRQKDGEAFKCYRSKMNSILNSYEKLDRKTIVDIQRDIIVPEMDAMESTIRRNKSVLFKSAVQDITLMGAGIGIGLFTGILPIDYTAILGIVGGIPAISDIISKARRSYSQDEIKGNSFYFLFKLQEKYKRI